MTKTIVMTHYELLFILPGTLAEGETEPQVQKVQEILTTAGATNVEMHDLGKNRIAYPIKHIRYGYFYIARFEAESEQVKDIEGKLRLTSELLRTLLQQYDPSLKVEPVITQVQPTQPVRGGQGADLTLPEMQQAPKAKPGSTAKKNTEEGEEKQVTLKEIDEKLDKILDADLSDV